MPTPTIITLEPILPVQIVAKAFPEVLAGDVDVSVNGTLYDTETAPGAVNIPVTNLDDDSVGVVTPGVGVKVGNSLVLIKKTGGALIESKAVVAEGVAETTIDDSVVVIKDSGGVTLYSKTVKADDVAEQVVNDATVNVRKSDGVLIAAVPVKAQSTEPYNVANSTVTMKDTAGATLDSKSVKATESAEFTAPNATAPIKDSAGTLLKTEVFKSGETRDVGIGDGTVAVKDSGGVTLHTKTVKAQGTAEQVVSDSVLTLNSGAFLSVKAQASQNIQLLSSVDNSPILPVSVVGPVIKVAPGSTPSGVSFKTIQPSQRIQFRPGDEGSREQAGWFNYTPPANPKAVADLDYSSANSAFVLRAPLVVNGVSSTTRFVDANGVQVFTSTNNANLVIIDKLTGMMYTRGTVAGGTWNDAVDAALAYSIVVNGVTYDDWFLYSVNEAMSMYNGQTDTQTGITLFSTTIAYDTWVSTTRLDSTTNSFYFQRAPRIPINLGKGFAGVPIVCVRNARNLITAP